MVKSNAKNHEHQCGFRSQEATRKVLALQLMGPQKYMGVRCLVSEIYGRIQATEFFFIGIGQRVEGDRNVPVLRLGTGHRVEGDRNVPVLPKGFKSQEVNITLRGSNKSPSKTKP